MKRVIVLVALILAACSNRSSSATRAALYTQLAIDIVLIEAQVEASGLSDAELASRRRTFADLRDSARDLDATLTGYIVILDMEIARRAD